MTNLDIFRRSLKPIGLAVALIEERKEEKKHVSAPKSIEAYLDKLNDILNKLNKFSLYNIYLASKLIDEILYASKSTQLSPELINEINDLINKVKNKIKDIIYSLDKEYVAKILKLKDVAISVSKCSDAEFNILESLSKEILGIAPVCKGDEIINIDEIREAIDAIIAKISTYLPDILAAAEKVVREIDLKEKVKYIRDETSKLLDEISKIQTDTRQLFKLFELDTQYRKLVNILNQLGDDASSEELKIELVEVAKLVNEKTKSIVSKLSKEDIEALLQLKDRLVEGNCSDSNVFQIEKFGGRIVCKNGKIANVAELLRFIDFAIEQLVKYRQRDVAEVANAIGKTDLLEKIGKEAESVDINELELLVTDLVHNSDKMPRDELILKLGETTKEISDVAKATSDPNTARKLEHLLSNIKQVIKDKFSLFDLKTLYNITLLISSIESEKDLKCIKYENKYIPVGVIGAIIKLARNVTKAENPFGLLNYCNDPRTLSDKLLEVKEAIEHILELSEVRSFSVDRNIEIVTALAKALAKTDVSPISKIPVILDRRIRSIKDLEEYISKYGTIPTLEEVFKNN
ncbi:MAG: hypothetical protein DSY42_00545, partial [Aquifex sp.]